MIDKASVLILVPALNEQDSVLKVLEELKLHSYETLLISDGSTDGTALVGRAFGVRVLELPINLGVGGALRAGFMFASKHGYQAVVQIDADGQHPVDEIKNLIQAANEHSAHMVIGSRFLMDEMTMEVSRMRRLAMRVLSRSATSATGTKITDSTSGFRLGNYKVIEIAAGLKPRDYGESTASTGSAVRFTLKGLGVATLRLHKRLSPAERQSS
jgi:glycosyltransferase involved in cell wall biosynthesis